MALLTLDIAFDWDSNPKGEYDGFCLVGASGFDPALAGSHLPPNAHGIGIQDRLQFQIYDISDQSATRTLANLAIYFQAAHSANGNQYPFDSSAVGPPVNGWYPLLNVSIGTLVPNSTSDVYGGLYNSWPVSPRPLSLPNAGWYFFKISFEATYNLETKSFGNDPEMIVRPSG